MAMMPAETPLTTPKASTEAMEGLLLVHAPPLTASARVEEPPTHDDKVPVIAPAEGVLMTVNEVVATPVPHAVITT